MTLYRGTRVLTDDGPAIVKALDPVTIEDEYGMARCITPGPCQSIEDRWCIHHDCEYARRMMDGRPVPAVTGYTAKVDREGWVTDIEDDEDSVVNREGDPAFNGAFR